MWAVCVCEKLRVVVAWCTGLGDIAVPGLLACLALRYDASRSTNMRARADAAAHALKGAFSSMDVSPAPSCLFLLHPLLALIGLVVVGSSMEKPAFYDELGSCIL